MCTSHSLFKYRSRKTGVLMVLVPSTLLMPFAASQVCADTTSITSSTTLSGTYTADPDKTAVRLDASNITVNVIDPADIHAVSDHVFSYGLSNPDQVGNTINILGGTISSSFMTVQSYAPGTINMSGGTVSTSGSFPGSAISGYFNSSLNITGGTVTSTGAGYAVAAHQSTLNISGTALITSTISTAVYAEANGNVSITGGTISGHLGVNSQRSSDGPGSLFVGGTANIKASGFYSTGILATSLITVENGTISADGQNATGVSTRDGKFTGGTISATGDNSLGISLFGTADISGSNIIASGQSSQGIETWLDSHLTIHTGSNITANGNGSYGIYAMNTESSLLGGNVSATGKGSTGMYSFRGTTELVGGALISGGTISSDGDNGFGFHTFDLNATISGGKITASGISGTGVDATGNAIVTIKGNAEILASGEKGIGIHTDYYDYLSKISTVNLESGTVSATGIGGTGLQLDREGTANITGGIITATDKSGVGIRTGKDTRLNASGGSITGGEIENGGYGLVALNNSVVNISGTASLDSLAAFGSSTVKMSGGHIGTVLAFDDAIFSITGGTIGGDTLYILGDGNVTVEGIGWALTGTHSGTFTDSTGNIFDGLYSTLTGTLTNGQGLNTTVFDAQQINGGSNGVGGLLVTVVIPETNTVLLALLGLAAVTSAGVIRGNRRADEC